MKYQIVYPSEMKKGKLVSLPDNRICRNEIKAQSCKNSSQKLISSTLSPSNDSRIISLTKIQKKPFRIFGNDTSRRVVIAKTRRSNHSAMIGKSPFQIPLSNPMLSCLSSEKILDFFSNEQNEAEDKKMNSMKSIAINKANQGLWTEAITLLNNVIYYQRKNLNLKNPHQANAMANTLYFFGVTLHELGDFDAAIRALKQGLCIVFPRRFKEKNIDLAAIFFEIGNIHGKKGYVSEITMKQFNEYKAQYGLKRKNQIGSKSA